MADLRLYIKNGAPEINLIGSDLEQDRGLCTSILISLLTDLSSTGGPGNWGDTISGKTKEQYVGSRLFDVKKNGPADRIRAVEYIKLALQWMIDDNIIASVDVATMLISPQWTNFIIKIKKPTGEELNFLYRKNWDNEQVFVERIME